MDNYQILSKIADGVVLSGAENQEFVRWARTLDNNSRQMNALKPSISAISAGVPYPIFPIFSVTLALDTATIALPIVGGFRNFMLLGSGRVSEAAAIGSVNARFNGDTAANYDFGDLYQTNTTVEGFYNPGETYVRVGWFPGTSTSANYVGAFTTYLYNYNSSAYKQTSTQYVTATQSTMESGVMHGIWKNTSKVTSMLLHCTGNFIAGSSFSLYGIT